MWRCALILLNLHYLGTNLRERELHQPLACAAKWAFGTIRLRAAALTARSMGAPRAGPQGGDPGYRRRYAGPVKRLVSGGEPPTALPRKRKAPTKVGTDSDCGTAIANQAPGKISSVMENIPRARPRGRNSVSALPKKVA